MDRMAESERKMFELNIRCLTKIWANRFLEPNVVSGVAKLERAWGQCCPSMRTIEYDPNLMRAPEELRVYVVIHELCHLKVDNHGKRFKALMDSRLPNWRMLKHRLNTEVPYYPE